MTLRSLKPVFASFTLLLVTVAAAQAQFAWRIVKHEGRDYLPLDNVAAFYQLQFNPRTVSNPLQLQGPRARVEVAGPRELLVNGVKQCLSFPLVVDNNQALISRFDLAKTLDPVLRPNAIPELRAFKTVVLDAGHGGSDRGANSATGGLEKDYTLDVIQNVKRQLLAKGYQVKMTRDADAFIPLEGRAQQANEEPDAIFVSVHFNSAADGGAANGFEVFAMTPRGALSTGDSVPTLDALKELPGNAVDSASLALATCVQHSLLGHIPQFDRGVKRARFVVLKLNKLPAVLVEGGFLTHPTESQRINEAAWRQKLAESIVVGVDSYKQVAEKRAMPRLLADYRMEQLPLAGRMVDPNTIAPAQASPGVLPTSNATSPGAPATPAAMPPPQTAAPEANAPDSLANPAPII